MPKSRGRKKQKSSRRPTQQSHPLKKGESPSLVGHQPRRKGRPEWHRPLGIAVVILGVGVIVVNYGEHMNLGWMPGGHNELYFFLGLVIAALGAWFLAAFDRPV